MSFRTQVVQHLASTYRVTGSNSAETNALYKTHIHVQCASGDTVQDSHLTKHEQSMRG